MTTLSSDVAQRSKPRAALAWRTLARDVAADRVARTVFAVAALLIAVGYSLLLPFAYTQRIELANWNYLNARYVVFSVAFAAGLAWLVALQVYAVRRVAAAGPAQAAGRTGPLAGLAAVASVLPSLLCCSPILPTLVGLLGLSATARLTTTGTLQHFFATDETLVLAGALALLVLSGAWSMRKVSRAACLADGCCTPESNSSQGGSDHE
ncbi:hypothetical protein [Conexibacter sp. S30A1]|uniref:hypothetical protein n=1 Tax=Conexibacter sp. S30A1 TaxID=2937800 RepID=UPI00200CF80D|nr:hypothetical protein [Conexibacter sp. S30A1]